jgi:hypothetical protein
VWAAWALALNNDSMDLTNLRGLLDRIGLMRALDPHRGREPRIGDWIERLAPSAAASKTAARVGSIGRGTRASATYRLATATAAHSSGQRARRGDP